MTKAKHIALRIIAGILVLLLAAGLSLQSPAVQSSLAGRVAALLSAKIGGNVTVGGVQILPFKTLIVKDILLLDDNPEIVPGFPGRDTVFYAGSAFVSFSLKDVTGSKPMVLDRVKVKDAVFNLVIEASRHDNLTRVLDLRTQGDGKLKDEGDVFLIREFDLRNVRYTMYDTAPVFEYRGLGINWADMDIVVNARGRNFQIIDASVRGIVDHMDAKEKSGYSFEHVSGTTMVTNGRVEVSDCTIRDTWSNLGVKMYSMRYENAHSFADYVHKVSMGLRLQDSRLGFKTITYYSGVEFPDVELNISDALASGPVDTLNVKRFLFTEKSGIAGRISGTLTEVTSLSKAEIDAKASEVSFTTAQLDKLLQRAAPGLKIKPAAYASGDNFTLNASVCGPFPKMETIVSLNSGSGSLDASAFLSHIFEQDAVKGIEGSFSTHELNLGEILGNQTLGRLSARGRAKAEFGRTLREVRLDSLLIDKAGILGYDYSGIAAAGSLKESEFNGRIVSSDPNLSFLFQGIFDLSKKARNALYKFYFNLGYADLNAINIDKRGVSKASMTINADFTRVRRGEVLGTVDIKGLSLENNDGPHDIGDIYFSSRSTDAGHRVNLNSSFAKGSYSGTKSPADMIAALLSAVPGRDLPSLGDFPAPDGEQDYKLKLKFLHTMDLLSFVLPGLYIADGTDLDFRLSDDGFMDASLSSQRIAWGETYLKDIRLDAFKHSASGTLANLTGGELGIGEFKVTGHALKLSAQNDSLSLGYAFGQDEDQIHGYLNLLGALGKDASGRPLCLIESNPSEFTLSGSPWTLNPSSALICHNGVKIPSLSLKSGSQEIISSGAFSSSQRDTLWASVRQLDLGAATPLAMMLPGLGGLLTMDATMTTPMKDGNFSLVADMECKDFMMSGLRAGDLVVKSVWNDDLERMDFKLDNYLDGTSPIEASGFYIPSANAINARCKLDNFELGYISGLISQVMSEFSGKASGSFSLAGPISRPSLYSRDARIDELRARVAFTNVLYLAEGPFSVDDYGISLDGMTLRDSRPRGGSGRVSGGLSFDHLKDLKIGIKADFENLEAFHTGDDGQSPVYGRVNATGNIAFTGTPEALTMSLNARSEGDGDFHISLRGNTTNVGKDLLTFKAPRDERLNDPYEVMMLERQAASKAAATFGVAMRLSIAPEVLCHLDIDRQSNNMINARGYGDISIAVPNANSFSIRGDYNIGSGNVHFNAMNLASRNFTIRDGSSIRFNGDIMESDLDVNAYYVTKASLSNLITDTTAVTSRRSVECGLKISDKLKNPQVRFSIDIPDLDPTTKSLVDNALSTEDKVQKQFLALLLTNSFVPDDQGGIFNTSDLLVSNVMEIMSGQLSNLIQSLDIPLDLGLKYQSNEGGTDIFDVAVSTRLFNDRVSVNGIIGNRRYSTEGAQSDVAGDLDIDIDLDKTGAIKLSLFSHSADKYSNYLDYSQRNGVGIGYRQEFDTFSQFLRDIFTPKAKRKARAEAAAIQAEKTTIVIESEDE